MLFVEDDEQLDKVLEVRAQLPKLRKIVVFDMEGLRDFTDPQVMSLDALARGSAARYDAAHPGRVGAAHRRAQAEDLAMLSTPPAPPASPRARCSRTPTSVSPRCGSTPSLRAAAGRRAHVLPAALPHGGARGGVYTAFFSGTRLNFVENPETVPENVREIAPTVFGAVPRIWEKFYSVVTDPPAARRARLQQLAYKLAIGIGYKVATLREEGKPVRRISPPRSGWRACWCSTMSARLIGVHRARLLITGAAPISPELIRWYMALGLEMVEVWGQTECGGHRDLQPARRREARLDRHAAAADGG